MGVTLIHAAVSDEVEKFGAYAGLAAVVGLAVLALLYFSQAREVKRLREWAGRGPERAAELEQRVLADAQRRVVAQPVRPQTAAGQQAAGGARPAPAAAATAAGTQSRPVGAPAPGAKPGTPGAAPAGAPGGAAAPGGAPAAPGGAPAAPGGAPGAPGAAPGGAPGGPSGTPGTPGAAPAGAPRPPGAPAAAPAGASGGTAATPGAPPAGAPAKPGTPGTAPAPGTPGAKPPAPAPATAAGQGAGARSTQAPPAPAPGATPANGATGQETRESAAARPGPPAIPRQAAAPPPRPPSQSPRFAGTPAAGGRQDEGGRSPARLTAMIGGGVAAVLLVGVLVLTQVGGDDEAPAPVNTIGAAPAPDEDVETPAGDERRTRTAPINRSATVVAVLNGTTQTGLARGVARELEDSGFTISTVGNNPDQARSATIVSYTTGNARAARTVADIIGVGNDAVEPIDRNTAVSAGDARVVVTVGADRIE